MKKIYSITISGIPVTFDMEEYSETIKIGATLSQLSDIYNHEDYRLLHDFKMAKYAHDCSLPTEDPIADLYKDKYLSLLQEVNERFPQ